MGLNIHIYKHAGRDYSNHGLTSMADGLCVVNADGPSDPSDRFPAVMLVAGPLGDPVLKPAVCINGQWEPRQGWFMFGGCYGATSDSRFGDALRVMGCNLYAAIPIHDRME